MTKKTDNLYTEAAAKVGSFRFDARVAEVFDDMISRSVPGYSQILSLLPTLTRQFKHANKNYYDLGCSTGAGLTAMARGLSDTPANLIGVDNSSSMIAEAEKLTQLTGSFADHHLDLVCADIIKYPIENAAMVLMNFTLQFIAMSDRKILIEQIYRGLMPGGVLVLSEKIKSTDQRCDELLNQVHHQYKADQGYSKLEISNKRDAIENVLIPETLAAHEQRLENAGFSCVTPWIRNLQFISILAIK